MKNILSKISLLVLMICLFVGWNQKLSAQQDPQYTQYMFNMQAINPAYTGSIENTLSATLLARRQWFNIPGAPVTQTFSIHAPLMNNTVGLGAVVVNDKIGLTNATAVLGSAAYHLKLKNSTLAFGAYFGFRQFRLDYSEARTSVGNNYDPAFDNLVTQSRPMVGAGLFYYTQNFYAGFSVPQLLNTRENVSGVLIKHFSHYFFNTGYVFDVSPKVSIRPSIMLKYVDTAPLSIDLNCNFWYNRKFGVGASYRVADSFDLLFEFQATKNLSIGYAYDLTLTKLGPYTSGSHELMIRYQGMVGKGGKDKIITPRLF